MRAKQVAATPVNVSVSEGPVQGVTPANADNLSIARQPISMAEEPATRLNLSDIKALVRQEKGWTVSLVGNHLIPPRGYEVVSLELQSVEISEVRCAEWQIKGAWSSFPQVYGSSLP